MLPCQKNVQPRWLSNGGTVEYVDSLHRNLLSLYVMHWELSAGDETFNTSPRLDMLVSYNFLVIMHGFKDILCELNLSISCKTNIWCDVCHWTRSRLL